MHILFPEEKEDFILWQYNGRLKTELCMCAKRNFFKKCVSMEITKYANIGNLHNCALE